MDKALAIITLFLCGYFLLHIFKPSGITETILVFFCGSTACITVWGYILSSLNRLSEISSWSIIGGLTATSVLIIAIYQKFDLALFQGLPTPSWTPIRRWYAAQLEDYPSYVRLILLLLTFTALLIGAINLVLVIIIAPHNWDSMTSHLPRVAQYFQQSNLNFFDANYWAQAVHPKNSALLFLFAFLVFGHNENLMQLVQYVCYWVAIVTVYGIARNMGQDKPQSIFAALVSALFVSGIVQATTTLNDLILTAYFGASIYFLFAFRKTEKAKYLYLAAIGLGLAVGTKASSLSVMPSILVIFLALTAAKRGAKKWLKNILTFCGATLLAVGFFAIPSGYIDNYRHFGNMIGTQDVRDIHAFFGKSAEYIARGGTYNILRYSYDSLSFDGLPPTNLVKSAQDMLHYGPRQILNLMGIDLEDSVAINFFPFEYDRMPSTNDGTYPGILGFGLVWVVVCLSLVRIIKNPDAHLLSLAAVVFLISISFSGPYDSSRGRYFSIAAFFAAPIVGICLTNKYRAFQVYLGVVVLAGCVSALTTITLKTVSFTETSQGKLEYKSVFLMDRIEQLTLHNPKYYRPIVAFEFLVPADAKVAVFLYPNTFEYPLYGRYLSRVIMPINSFYKGLQPIPSDAQFLLYADGYPCSLPKDIHLGEDWFLRKLSEENRDCPLPSKP